MLTSTRFTRPTASLPVLQSTSRERPDSVRCRRLARRLRPLMLERGSFLPTVQPFELGLPPPPPPDWLPPPPPDWLPPPPPDWFPPPPAPGIATSDGGPTLRWSSNACTDSTAPAGSCKSFAKVVPPATGGATR